MDSEQDYEEFEQKSNEIFSLYYSLTECAEYIPYKQFEKAISSISSILEQYKYEENSPIQQIVGDINFMIS